MTAPLRRRARAAATALGALALPAAHPVAPFAQRPHPSAPPPDLILTGGKVFTADPAHPWGEALAIRGERIAAVGTTAEIVRRAGPRPACSRSSAARCCTMR